MPARDAGNTAFPNQNLMRMAYLPTVEKLSYNTQKAKSDAVSLLSGPYQVPRPESRSEPVGLGRTLQNNPRVRQKNPSWADDISRIDNVCESICKVMNRKTNSLMDQGGAQGLSLLRDISALYLSFAILKEIPFRITPDLRYLSN